MWMGGERWGAAGWRGHFLGLAALSTVCSSFSHSAESAGGGGEGGDGGGGGGGFTWQLEKQRDLRAGFKAVIFKVLQ
jgi:hypothetical protein